MDIDWCIMETEYLLLLKDRKIRDVRRGYGMPFRLPTPDNGRIHGSVVG
jgi:hypothetical protein